MGLIKGRQLLLISEYSFSLPTIGINRINILNYDAVATDFTILFEIEECVIGCSAYLATGISNHMCQGS